MERMISAGLPLASQIETAEQRGPPVKRLAVRERVGIERPDREVEFPGRPRRRRRPRIGSARAASSGSGRRRRCRPGQPRRATAPTEQRR